jgi:hypothetical protein
MPRHPAFRLAVAAIALALVQCGSGDLTLPSQGPGALPPPGAPQPALLDVVSGDGQEAKAGAVLDKPLTVRVLDGSAQPLPGTPVRFSFAADFGGATLDPDSAVTDAEGRASSVARLGDEVGEQVVIAQVVSAAPLLATQFTATAVSGKGGDGHGGHGGGNED